jgi:hypothetical protein
MKEIREVSSNEFYGGMNRRFAKRERLLRKLGFEYVREGQGRSAQAKFIRVRGWNNLNQSIPSMVVLSAPNRVWYEMVLSSVLNRG